MLPPVKFTDPRAIDLKKKQDIANSLEFRYENGWHSRSDIGLFYRQVLSYQNPDIDEESSAENENNSETCNYLDENPCTH